MKMKRIVALVLFVAMTAGLVQVNVYGASTQSVIDAFGGEVLFSAPDGWYDGDSVENAFEGWSAQITSGKADVRTYDGTTLTYYVETRGVKDNITSIKSPSYGVGRDIIIIEWEMYHDTANDLYFDFSFVDSKENEIAFLKLDKNAVEPGRTHPDTNNNDLYAMGFPDNGVDCAIVAVNNDDGLTHTVYYYVNGEITSTISDASGRVDGFGGIKSSNGMWSTSNMRIGFTNLTVGAADEKEIVNITAEYVIGSEVVNTVAGAYIEGEAGHTFKGISVFYNGDVYSCQDTVLSEDGRIELTKAERYKTKTVGEVFEFEGVTYKVTGDSTIANGDFITGDTSGWTNRTDTAITGGRVEYQSDIMTNALIIQTGGKNAANSIGTSWSVTPGQKYYVSFYVGGSKPTSGNYQYNRLFDGDKSTELVAYGAEMTNNVLTRFERIITPLGSSVYFQSSWASGDMYFAGFEMLPVEEYTEEETETPAETRYPVQEDAFVRYGTIYGINNTNSDGVCIASSADVNRGPEKDANGETTYLEGASPTTLGSTRVGLMKFNIRRLDENERATLKFYVKNWHSQGFDGGNTFLRIAATPLNNSNWASLDEGAIIAVENEPLLEGWSTPVFSKKAAKSDEVVEIDVTEAVRCAYDAGMKDLSFKLQIFWGAAYVVEREAAESGEYEGKSAFIEITEDDNLKKITTSGTAILTKNGSQMNGFCYVSDSDDVRMQLEGAYAIGSDSGYYFPNERIAFNENTDVTNTMALGFGLTMLNGAQVRFGGGLDSEGNVGDGNGLRFIVSVDRNDTLAGLDDAEIGVVFSAEDSGNTIDVVTQKWQNDYTFTTALTNIAVGNYNRKYTAKPYVRIGDKTFTGEGVTRSIYEVASGLLVRGSTDNTVYPDDAMNQMLYDVLNAYVNQVGIRLSFTDNADFTDWELRARETGKGAYTGDAFFEVGETLVDGKVYSVTLTPLGNKTKIKTEGDYWNKYVRINNNNSQIKVLTTLSDNGDGTYKLSFDTTNLSFGTYPEEKLGRMKPTYERAVDAMKKANSFWQNYQSYDNWYGSTHPAFWDKAAYHTGNMEYYLLTGDDTYLDYTINWARYNNWMGNNNTTAAPSEWTWGYNQTQGSNAVLFGDWQTCFQVYIDLYNAGIEGASIDRVLEVINYQITTDRDEYWWWADALYMVMPTMTKLYKLTGDEKYLDALYKYFKYAKELMYDGPGGIPSDASGYTTSAALNSGASYSNPDDYKYLFFRDAGYVYPLKPNAGHENEKNFWARGNGWVFAALSKVLGDMPNTYEHYDEFYNTYVEMAEAVVECQQLDEAGYGFWTQSMLQDYPKGSSGNEEGYETSGTAFLTYGLFRGVNNGILTDVKYEYAAIRGWGYLENVALLSDGKVGYVQPIGSNATQATPEGTTVNFGVGAFLLASCEAARWASK